MDKADHSGRTTPHLPHYLRCTTASTCPGLSTCLPPQATTRTMLPLHTHSLHHCTLLGFGGCVPSAWWFAELQRIQKGGRVSYLGEPTPLRAPRAACHSRRCSLAPAARNNRAERSDASPRAKATRNNATPAAARVSMHATPLDTVFSSRHPPFPTLPPLHRWAALDERDSRRVGHRGGGGWWWFEHGDRDGWPSPAMPVASPTGLPFYLPLLPPSLHCLWTPTA